ncbi:MAG: 2-dehydro-3-deoxygalactonokinase [Planctomycetaceae bacterium]|nr:2-dehydro-3-deoxygalactonokinase [Planctomycetaceae bacterium]
MNNLFFNCDWGTSRFRLRLVDAESRKVLHEVRTDEGVSCLAAGDREVRAARFQQVLAEHVAEVGAVVDADVSRAPILVSGMASSTMGWRDLPYARLPFSLDGAGASRAVLDVRDARLTQPVVLFSGVRSDRDVMRGEETELMGLRVAAAHWFEQPEDVWVILPGTHSKHVRICGGTMTEFHTHMTGELYQLLSQQSSLRHPDRASVTAELLSSELPQWKEAFLSGVDLACAGSLSGQLFQVRTGQVLRGDSAVQSAAFLSGILIGDELRSLTLDRCPDGRIVLAAGGELSASYQLACEQLGISDRVAVIPPAEVALLSAWGQWTAWQALKVKGSC